MIKMNFERNESTIHPILILNPTSKLFKFFYKFFFLILIRIAEYLLRIHLIYFSIFTLLIAHDFITHPQSIVHIYMVNICMNVVHVNE